MVLLDLPSTDAPAPFDQEINTMAEALAGVTRGGVEDPEALAHDYAALAGRIAEAAAEAGYAGLPDACLLFQDRLRGLAGTRLSEPQCASLRAWPELVRSYLEAPGHRDAGAALIEHLCDPIWELALGDDDVQMFKAMLLLNGTPNGPIPAPASLSSDIELPPQSISAMDDFMVPTLEGVDDDSPLPGDGDPIHPANAGASGPNARASDTTDPLESTPIATPPVALEQLPAAVRELIEILVGELPQIETAIAQTSGLTTAASVGDDVRSQAYENLSMQLQRFGAAGAAVGFAGLELACSRARDSVRALADDRTPLTAEVSSVLSAWLQRLREYLSSPGAEHTSRALAEALSWPGLARPTTAMEASELTAVLMAPDFSEVVAGLPTRATIAQEEDVSLELPEDVNHDLLDGLLQELPVQTELFSAAVQRLVRGGTLQDVEIAQRIAHTLKGAGNTVGVRGIARLTHQLEDILLALAKHQALPSRPLAETILNAADCLAGMSEYLTGAGDPPADALAVLQEVLEWANRIDNEGIAAIHSAASAPPARPLPPSRHYPASMPPP
jgi:chemosensory pili system protein ChpA (sensor histidine kinase/response regulator)